MIIYSPGKLSPTRQKTKFRNVNRNHIVKYLCCLNLELIFHIIRIVKKKTYITFIFPFQGIINVYTI